MSKEAPLFATVYAEWLKNGIERNLDRFRPQTVKTYKSQSETHILPLLGHLPVNVVGSKELNLVVTQMVKDGYAASTIATNVNIMKEIREFPRDDNGPSYPIQWDSKVIDAPAVNKRLQKTPKASTQVIQEALKCTSGLPSRTQALLALLAGSGMRIQEALAITTQDNGQNTVWVPEESKIIIRQQRDGNRLGPVKTEAGVREVDLAAKLNNWLQFVLHPVNDINGFVFNESESFYGKRFKKCGVIGGFHSLRRFRVTHLKLSGVPYSLIHFWIGHEEDDGVTGRYTEVGTEIAARKVQADNAGLKFELPE